MNHKKRDIVIGINDEHDAGCALIIDGQLIAAYSEERFSRKKMHNGASDGLPSESLKNILADFNIKPDDIDYVAYNFPGAFYLMKQIYKDLWKQKCRNWWLSGFLNKNFYGIGDYVYPVFDVWRKSFKLNKLLKRFDINVKKVVKVDHHVAHAASAYYTSGLQNVLVLTLDAQGSGLSGSISVGSGPHLFRKATVSKYNSLGLLYSTITKGLGFKPMRHEGKILGLAAFGDPGVFYEKFRDAIECKGLDIDFKLMRKYPSPIYPNFMSLNYIFEKEFEPWSKGQRENLSAALQKRTEEIVCEWALNAVKEFGCRDLAVAGGVFANVKVNQRLQESPEINSLHVFPAMGDCGLPVGAALYVYYQKFKPGENITKFPNTYLGKNFSDDEIKNILNRLGIRYTYCENVEKEVAKLLYDNNVVARYNGRVEYGPRALGNRSILYSGKDREVNKWLNQKLDRTEFMPFAPSTLHEDAPLYYRKVDVSRLRQPASFMTITFECTDRMKKDCPAAVHVDNTARPQLVREENNPSYYKIINEYKKLSGSGTIVNTSFNAHEEPIVNSPKDAIRCFLITRLDALAIGDYLIFKKDV
jgi:carbamoyltransferase